ncbi:hypothetical protein KJ557_00330 [Patescibacteria group bacterium]|nr:hypothetical protein [Patescibacteria group bacterium]
MNERRPTGEKQAEIIPEEEKKESSIIIETPVGASGRKISSEVEEGAKRMLEGIKREKELRVREKRERGELLSAQEVATLRALEIKRAKNREPEAEEAGSALEGSGVHEGAWEEVGSGPEVVGSGPEIASSSPESSGSGPEGVSSAPISSSGPEGTGSDPEVVGSGVETLEQTPLEKLDEARMEFARDYVEMEKVGRAGGTFKTGNKITAEIISEIREGNLESYEHYKEALREYRDRAKEDLMEKGLEGEELENEAKQIILETVAEEANKLYDAKTDIKLEKGEKDSGLETFGKNVKKIGTWYRKLPLKAKLAVSVGLLGGGIGGAVLGGVTGTAIITGAFVGSLAQRLLGGVATGVATEGGFQKVQEWEEKKGVEKEFKENFLSALNEQNDDFDQKVLEIEGGKKAARVRRIAAGGIIGSFVGGGFIGKAIDWWRGEAPAPETTVPPVETIVQPGDSVWSIAEDQLQEKGYFDGLKGSADEVLAKKTYLIDAIKDKVVANPSEFGIGSGNADKIFPGDKLNLTSIFKDKSLLDGFVNKANGLSASDVENILNYNNVSEMAEAGQGGVEQTVTGHVEGAEQVVTGHVEGAEQVVTGHVEGAEQVVTGHVEGAGPGGAEQTVSGHVEEPTPGPEGIEQTVSGHVTEVGAGSIPEQTVTGYVPETGAEQLVAETARIDSLAEQIGQRTAGGKDVWDFYKDKPAKGLIEWFQADEGSEAKKLLWKWRDGDTESKIAERLLQHQDKLKINYLDALGNEKSIGAILKEIVQRQIRL